MPKKHMRMMIVMLTIGAAIALVLINIKLFMLLYEAIRPCLA